MLGSETEGRMGGGGEVEPKLNLVLVEAAGE